MHASSGGALMNMTTAQAKIILKEITSNSQQFGSRRAAPSTFAFKVSKSSNMEQQMAALANLVKHALVSKVCAICSIANLVKQAFVAPS